MKSSTLILYFAVWSISLAAAYYLGSYGGNVGPNAEQAVKLPTELKKPKLIQTLAIETVATYDKNALAAYFSGDVSLLEDAFLEIPMLCKILIEKCLFGNRGGQAIEVEFAVEHDL